MVDTINLPRGRQRIEPRDAAHAKRLEKGRKSYLKLRQRNIDRSAKWKLENKGYCASYATLYRSTKISIEKVLFNNAKMRAKAAGIEFSIQLADIVVPKFCPALGIELKVATEHAKDNSPSLDRIDCAKGYVPGNVAVISHKANTIKSNAGLSEIKLVLAYMEKQHGTD